MPARKLSTFRAGRAAKNACIIHVYMAISESQLETWSHQGAVTSSASTYAAIDRALSNHNWPSGMSQKSFLQGSYANSTNIRGNSDVDIIVEDTSLYYHNLSSDEFSRLNLSPGTHNYQDFRREVISALTNHFGSAAVDTSGSKAITVAGQNGRLKADVLPAFEYHNYENSVLQVKGITFFTHPAGQQIINYPKQHIDNGQAKNGGYRTNGNYKPSVRMFKNLREQLIAGNDSLRSKFPSYFVECLIYNVPDGKIRNSRSDTFVDSVNFLAESFRDGSARKFTTGSGWHWLFGAHSVQWSENEAKEFVDGLISYWNNN